MSFISVFFSVLFFSELFVYFLQKLDFVFCFLCCFINPVLFVYFFFFLQKLVSLFHCHCFICCYYIRVIQEEKINIKWKP